VAAFFFKQYFFADVNQNSGSGGWIGGPGGGIYMKLWLRRTLVRSPLYSAGSGL